ncbi:Bug family tripartite tricarboxylate transporter substrate binding protein [Aquabacterium sp.]|uniref:Bug family tripartite tricarboxylate transporter substrate binding protein n=1 Tax=Aquabacterium sp. TaxID=1872578 RepID=UPI002CE69960|nr:tripartite tricarboxylate transporter substrate binding protein [Aquabacterium sp.]HSW05809.1 tripartite tricarboxylate transporter substrate binding protein [Aquabacterium sp.]
MFNRPLWIALASWCLAAALAPAALAADWPSKPITLVVPFPAGGSTDAVARLIAQRLGARLNQTLVVENKAGAGGNLGTDFVAKAAPDGYTLALTTSGPLANNKLLYKAMPFDPAKDLSPIVLVGEIPLVFAANPSVKAHNLKQFFDDARAKDGRMTIANPGNGTIGHLAAALTQAIAKTDAIDVPYKGDTPAMSDLMGGMVDMVSAPLTAFVANIKAGKLKGLAVTSKKRFPLLPDVPTAIEQGFEVEASVWFGVVGPAQLPAAVVKRLNTEINAVLALPEVSARLQEYGATVGGGTPELLAERMASDAVKWKKVIDSARITLE